MKLMTSLAPARAEIEAGVLAKAEQNFKSQINVRQPFCRQPEPLMEVIFKMITNLFLCFYSFHCHLLIYKLQPPSP
jgi:hypothetical protein